MVKLFIIIYKGCYQFKPVSNGLISLDAETQTGATEISFFTLKKKTTKLHFQGLVLPMYSLKAALRPEAGGETSNSPIPPEEWELLPVRSLSSGAGWWR